MAAAAGHPFSVCPFVIQIPHEGAGLRRDFVVEGKRVRFVDSVPMEPGGDVVLVQRTLEDAGNKAVPDSRLPRGRQGMARSIPAVEISQDGDLRSIGCPDRKVGSGLTPRIQDVGAELLVESKMTPFVKEIGVVSG